MFFFLLFSNKSCESVNGREDECMHERDAMPIILKFCIRWELVNANLLARTRCRLTFTKGREHV